MMGGDRKEAPPGFEPGMADLQSAGPATQPIAIADISANGPERLALCLALLAEKSPDLALLAERWDALPDAVRTGIMAMVRTTALEEKR
jgi:hypothetical protein